MHSLIGSMQERYVKFYTFHIIICLCGIVIVYESFIGITKKINTIEKYLQETNKKIIQNVILAMKYIPFAYIYIYI